MTSTAPGDSSSFSRPNDEQWAIATGLVAPADQGNQQLRRSLPLNITSTATSHTTPFQAHGHLDHNQSSTANPSLITGATQASTSLSQSNPRPSASELDNFSAIPLLNSDGSQTAALLADTTVQNTIASTTNRQTVAARLPEDNLTLAQRIQFPEFERTGALMTEAASLYQFTAAETGVFTANLSGLSADADIQLIQDINENGRVDAGEIVAWEWERGNQDESIRHFLQAGDYVLRVLEQNSSPGPTNYNITTSFRATETDNRAFSINVLYQQGAEQLNARAREAIEQAATFWENIISHSSFDRSLEFALGIYGTTNPDPSLLAYAGPFSYRNTGTTGNENTEDKLLPVVGFTVLNNLYLEQYNSNPDYLESVVRHEIAHALGLGTIWESQGNDLVNRDQGSYKADTYAGQSYGDLLGTGLSTAVPLDAVRDHWSEEIFDTELLTPQAEGIGEALPLSALTISSLRDLGWHVNYGAAEAFTLPSNPIA